MPLKHASGLPGSDVALCVVDRLKRIERLATAAIISILIYNVFGQALPSLAPSIGGLRPMSAGAGLAAVLGLATVIFSNSKFVLHERRAEKAFALLLTFWCALVCVSRLTHGPAWNAGATGQGPFYAGGIAPEFAASFLLLGVVLLLLRARRAVLSVAADSALFILVLVVLTIISAHIIEGLHGIASPSEPWSTMACLLLLTVVAFVRRAQRGFFSILLGRGFGSRIARSLCPILVVMPYLREGLRARLVDTGHLPTQYTTAILASLTAAVTVGVAIYVGWRFSQMETEIQSLSLRDPLTGLYNLRGFELFADRALLLANRNQGPFSVLFVDVDDLKLTNDRHGHRVGSEFLLETAAILKSVFRETDVIGRIGGDEFAVAGQFSETAIQDAMDRLQISLALRNEECAAGMRLQISAGHVTTQPDQCDSLTALLAEADEAMYEEKRRRKALISPFAAQIRS